MLHGQRNRPDMLSKNPIALIVVAQLFGTSLWFSANGVADALTQAWGISLADVGTLTNAVQFGFIVGTLVFALTGLADRFSASRIFAISAVLGALANAAFGLLVTELDTAVVLRFIVGLSLAGVYPLGMKLVVSWAPERAGAALAWLVGMLTLGTALPHGIRLGGGGLPWQIVVLASSMLAIIAAVMVFRLGDGPHLKRREGSPRLKLGRVLYAFRLPAFRASALGYFGHQWELYALWTLVPLLVVSGGLATAGSTSVSGLAFAIVAAGTIGCIAGGRLSQHIGSARVAALSLALSALCCALYPLAAGAVPGWLLLTLLLIWGASVVADSPHFSALSARACPPEIVGSALALQNAIGFAITMVSIAIGTRMIAGWGNHVAWLLLPGPLLGLIGLWPLWRRKAVSTG